MLPHGGEASRVTMLKGFAQALGPLGMWGVTLGCMRSSRSGARVEEEPLPADGACMLMTS